MVAALIAPWMVAPCSPQQPVGNFVFFVFFVVELTELRH